MRLTSLAVACGIVLLACGPLAAQTPEPPPAAVETPAPTPAPTAIPAPPEASPRYSFNRVEGGFLRLDSATGQVALCSQRAAGWACQAVPEERVAFETEVARLTAEVEGLKTEIAALRAPVAPPRPPAELAPRVEGDAKSDPKSGLKLPTDEDIQGARSRIQNIWRQFVDMVAEMQKDLGKKS
jgi:hypothetical protein